MNKDLVEQQVTPGQVFELLVHLNPAQQRDFLQEVKSLLNDHYAKRIEQDEVNLNESHKAKEIFNGASVGMAEPVRQNNNLTFR